MSRGGHNKGKAQGSPKQRAIEAEYDEPFLDVLRGFAAMGYGCDTTARVLGYHASTFRQLLKRRPELAVEWPPIKEQVIMRDREPFTHTTRVKLSIKAKAREARKREARLKLAQAEVLFKQFLEITLGVHNGRH